MAGNNGDREKAVKILTPFEQQNTYVFSEGTNEPRYVVEVPGVRFNGLPVCLASKNVLDAKKLHVMKIKFKRVWDYIADKCPELRG